MFTTDNVFNAPSDLVNNFVGWCDYICCDRTTDETCYWDYDNNNFIPPSCAAIVDGGCPCPDGTEKCGAGKILCLPWHIAVHSLLIFLPSQFSPINQIRPR